MTTYASPGVYVVEKSSGSAPIAGVGTSTAALIGIFGDTIKIPRPNPKYNPSRASNTPAAAGVAPAETPQAPKTAADNSLPYTEEEFAPLAAGKVQLCTNFGEFRKYFGDFSTDAGQSKLAHAVYGFFNNGGTRCFVVRVKADSELATALEQIEAIDEIALVAAPGLVTAAQRAAIVAHCAAAGDRFAILDSPVDVANFSSADKLLPSDSDLAAFYFPWIQIFDPAAKIRDPQGDGLAYVPPSGHIAGIFARVDAQRGVHKAPANEPILGAVGLRYNISRRQQDGLNPQGVNCLRNLNGRIQVWGARTIGGDRNGEWKYINIRRLFLFLRESIDEGTQWAVFEPNSPELWSRITRNISAFLTNIWRAGGLMGSTPEEAFYVKCDAETNPPEVRALGQVVTEIGVAVIEPAEFVIFHVRQWAGPSK